MTIKVLSPETQRLLMTPEEKLRIRNSPAFEELRKATTRLITLSEKEIAKEKQA